MRIIAYYLPQFHNIPENDEWWGDGFTEWVNVKAAKPQFPGHDQPRKPLNGNYYNLLDNDVKRWQVRLAKEYGIYGFCYYHYWFDGRMLLEKPMEQMLADPSIDLPFCISWANESWTKSWTGKQSQLLIVQRYGDEKEWHEHFDYLLQFFKDDRYIKIDGKPFFVVYRPEIIDCLDDMLEAWDRWAREAGFNGMAFAHQANTEEVAAGSGSEVFEYGIEYQPRIARTRVTDTGSRFGTIKKARRQLAARIESLTGINIMRYGSRTMSKIGGHRQLDWDAVWKAILEMAPISPKSIPGAFSMWDNTPRYGADGEVYVNSSPDKLERYMAQQIVHARDTYHSDMLMFFAWNEWAEGGYLEPDETDGHANLSAIRDALKATGEWPVDYSTDL